MVSQTDGVAGAGNDAAANPASPVLGGANEALIDPPNPGGGSATFADLLLSGFTRRGVRKGIVRRNDSRPVQEDPVRKILRPLENRLQVPGGYPLPCYDGYKVGAVKGTHRNANQACAYLSYIERVSKRLFLRNWSFS
jgi:hypothetical protein